MNTSIGMDIALTWVFSRLPYWPRPSKADADSPHVHEISYKMDWQLANLIYKPWLQQAWVFDRRNRRAQITHAWRHRSLPEAGLVDRDLQQLQVMEDSSNRMLM